MKVESLLEMLSTVPEAVGQTVKAERERRGWSQHRLAEELTTAGQAWHQTTVAKTEAGTRPLKLVEAVALVTVLKLGTLDSLFGDDRFKDTMLWAMIDDLRAEQDRMRQEARAKLAQVAPAELTEFDAAMGRIDKEAAAESAKRTGQQDHLEELIKALESATPASKNEGDPDK